MSAWLRGSTRFLWLAGVLSVVGCGVDRQSPEVLHQRGQLMLERGKFGEAIDCFAQAIDKTRKAKKPPVAEMHYDLGLARERAEKYEAAAAAYSEAIKLQPKFSRAFNNRAVCYAKLKQMDPAIADWSEAVKLDPRDFLAYRNRGLAHFEKGEFEAALRDYDESIRLNPLAPEGYLDRGRALIEIRQIARAIQSYDRALEFDPQSVEGYILRGAAHRELNNIDLANQDFALAKTLDPEVKIPDKLPGVEVVTTASPAPKRILTDNDAIAQRALKLVNDELQRRGFENPIPVTKAPFALIATRGGEPQYLCVKVLDVAAKSFRFPQEHLANVRQQTAPVHLVIVRGIDLDAKQSVPTAVGGQVDAFIESWTPKETELAVIDYEVSIPKPGEPPASPKQATKPTAKDAVKTEEKSAPPPVDKPQSEPAPKKVEKQAEPDPPPMPVEAPIPKPAAKKAEPKKEDEKTEPPKAKAESSPLPTPQSKQPDEAKPKDNPPAPEPTPETKPESPKSAEPKSALPVFPIPKPPANDAAAAELQQRLRLDLQRPIDERLQRIEAKGYAASGLFMGKIHQVGSDADLRSAADKARPGDQLVLRDGEWKDVNLLIRAQGTAAAPILVRPETPAGVTITGDSTLRIVGEHLIVSDLQFVGTNPTKSGAFICRIGDGVEKPASNCIVHRLRFADCNAPDADLWPKVRRFLVNIDGPDNTVAYCQFLDFKHIGQIVSAGRLPTEGLLRLHILHNQFLRRPHIDEQNGYEVIQIGYSGELARPTGALIEGNRFEQCDGENETITVKASDVVVRRNEFVGCQGCLCLRSCNRVLVENNLFDGQGRRGAGGVRIQGADHVIVGNEFRDLVKTGSLYDWSISLMAASSEDYGANGDVAGYGRAKNILVLNNRFVNTQTLVAVGIYPRPEYPLLPRQITARGNRVTGREPSPTLFDWQPPDAANELADQLHEADTVYQP